MKRHEKSATYEHRSFMIIDVEDSSSRPDPGLIPLRADLYRVTRDALARTLSSSAQWHSEDRGDGILVLMDSAVPKIDIVGPLLDHLVAGLSRHNEHKSLQEWMRLRVALHTGEVQRDREGWAGDALTTAFRLSEAQVVKKTFAAAPRAQCIIVASDYLFQAVIRHGHPLVKADDYRPVSVPLHDGSMRAWVRVPGYAVPPSLPPPATASAAGRSSSQDVTIKAWFNDKVDVKHDINIS
ncbi:MAG: hypothetical protein ACRDR6_01205 [Pseudonocardiaceae bacterium]